MFSLLGLRSAYVARQGALVGVITLNEVRSRLMILILRTNNLAKK